MAEDDVKTDNASQTNAASGSQLLRQATAEIQKQKLGPAKAEMLKLLKEKEEHTKAIKLIDAKLNKIVEDTDAGLI